MIAGTSSLIKSRNRFSISAWRKRWIAGIASKVLEISTASTGSFRKTSVKPFCFEKTRMMIPESWKQDNRRSMGTVSGTSAAKIPREVNAGVN
jgi:hypothetical protein